jgi:hypothetical protein
VAAVVAGGQVEEVEDEEEESLRVDEKHGVAALLGPFFLSFFLSWCGSRRSRETTWVV